MGLDLSEKGSESSIERGKPASAEVIYSKNLQEIRDIRDAFSLKFRTGHFSPQQNPSETSLTYLQKEEGTLVVVTETVKDSGERKRGNIVTKLNRVSRPAHEVEENLPKGFHVNFILNGVQIEVPECCNIDEFAAALTNQKIETGEVLALRNRSHPQGRVRMTDEELQILLSLEG